MHVSKKLRQIFDLEVDWNFVPLLGGLIGLHILECGTGNTRTSLLMIKWWNEGTWNMDKETKIIYKRLSSCSRNYWSDPWRIWKRMGY